MKSPNLEHFRTFADVIELGNFSAAAERRGLSQPAVSQQMRQLERQLGVRLIERVARRATPTVAGMELMEHIRRIDAAVQGAAEAMEFHATGVTGRVRLGTGATACVQLLPPLLRMLRRKFPALSVVVSTGNAPEILRGVEANTLDLALVTLPAPGKAFQLTPIMKDEFVAIFPRSYAQASVQTSPLALSKLPLVLFEPGANTRSVVDEWFMRAALTPKPVMELGSVEAIKEMVAAELGCGILPRLAVSGSARRAGLRVRSLSPRLERTLAMVLRRDKPLNRALQQVVNAILTLKQAGLSRRSAPAG